MSITANTMADVVAVVIHCLGFTPTSSVVLTLVNGTSVVCTLRVDAQPHAQPRELAARVTGYTGQIPAADGALMVSFEDEKALTLAQYRALGDALSHTGTPLRGAVLVTGGHIMDYDGDSTDSVPFTDAATSPTALEMMLKTEAPALLAANVPACRTGRTEAIQAHAANAAGLDAGDAETRAVARGTLADLIEGYRTTGAVSADHAAWLAGTLTHCGFRDLLATSLATSEDGEAAMAGALLGTTAPESWEHLRTAARALAAALEHIPTKYRAEILTIIGWTRWIDGMSTEADRFFALAQQADPGHTLSTQMLTMINKGHLPPAALQAH